MRPVRRRALVVALPFVLAWAVVVATFAGLRDRLPDPLATHFGADGKADGFTGTGAFLSVVTAVLLGSGLLTLVPTLRLTKGLGVQRFAVALGYGMSGLLGYAFAALLFANADATRASRVSQPLWQLGIALAVAAAMGALGWLLASRDAASGTDPGKGAAVPRLPLAKGEAATWTRSVGSPVLLAVGAGTTLLGAVLVAVGPGTGAWLIVIGLICTPLARCRVTVDRRGLAVASWFAPRPRMRIPLDRIERATSREAAALSLGGWGYRIRGGGSALVFRSGDALFLTLATGREFAVTVDDAATAAALLNTLIERDRPAAGERG
ncbi:DUF1648 domain-containing protein [Streptomyces sp. 110]|uniref:DUF1648 domain-containing protein n=1 Tax=Streptomyces endocoffeicus TaxID=2898945 RepID=A0ABS1PRA8_9ACTN|nr:DUF1648 domain-containing protein [Streptomyces endocoffeicus]MBL1114968.1 DUF1648 domain-containing protein [Streptomyces endocoffeicus]